MAQRWPALPYRVWHDTCDTLHLHTQVLGKLAVALAPPEPQLHHAALRLTARGWETAPLTAPNGSGAFVAALDLRRHEGLVEHEDGRELRVSLVPDQSVGEVAGELLDAVAKLAGPVRINPHPQEVPWTTTPLLEDLEHRTYDPGKVAAYLEGALRAASVLAALRAPFRGRSSPVDAWWGGFDLCVYLYSGRPADPPSDDFIARNSANVEQIGVGWWPGDVRYPHAAFYGFVAPAPTGFADASLAPSTGRWEGSLGEYLLDWDVVVGGKEPFATAVQFGRAVVAHACQVSAWDPLLAASAQGVPPPIS